MKGLQQILLILPDSKHRKELYHQLIVLLSDQNSLQFEHDLTLNTKSVPIHTIYIISLSQTKMIKLIFFALLISISLSACPSRYGVGDYTFNINYTTSDCSVFQFINCTHDEASDTQSQTITTDYWGDCLYDSCKIYYADLTTQTLRKCDQYATSKKAYLAVVIVFAIFFGILLSVIITVILIMDRQLCWQGFKDSFSFFQEREIRPREANDQINQSNTMLKEQVPKPWLEWTVISAADMIDKGRHNKNCAICIQEKPSVQLNCSHSYHSQCIIAWTYKSYNCPLCRTLIVPTDIITKICEKCYLRKKVIHSLRESERQKFCYYCQTRILEKIKDQSQSNLKQQYIDHL